MRESEILDLLQSAGALIDGHFRLSSGAHSPRYLQCALALARPRIAERLGAALADAWRRERDAEGPGSIAPVAVVSPAIGGIVIGHEVGRALGVRALFVERDGDGMALRRGFGVAGGEPLLVVDDVLTTGRSVREAVAAVRRPGARPVGVACIANRSGRDTLDDLPVASLLELEIPVYDPDACPLCADGVPVEKPGSRAIP